RLVLRNAGTAPLLLSSSTLNGPFTLSPSLVNRTLGINESVALTITFNAATLGSASGTLNVFANDSGSPHAISLQTGNTYAERLVKLREGGPTLRGIAMNTSGTGWAVGDEGAVFKTENGGRS